MGNELILENYLLVLKSTVEVYVHGTLESSNPDVLEILKSGLDSTMKSQADVYKKMTEYGWYQINNVENNKISKTLEKVTQ